MLKKLSKKEVQAFVNKFEIKCSSITLEKIKKDYFIIIDEQIRLQVKYNSISEFI